MPESLGCDPHNKLLPAASLLGVRPCKVRLWLPANARNRVPPPLHLLCRVRIYQTTGGDGAGNALSSVSSIGTVIADQRDTIRL